MAVQCTEEYYPKTGPETTSAFTAAPPSLPLQLWGNMSKSTRKKDRIRVNSAAKDLFRKFTCKRTYCGILVTSPFCAMSVARVSSPMRSWRNTSSCIPLDRVKPLTVVNVTPSTLTVQTWKSMLGDILESCHSLAPNVRKVFAPKGCSRNILGHIRTSNLLLALIAVKRSLRPRDYASISSVTTHANWHRCLEVSAWCQKKTLTKEKLYW